MYSENRNLCAPLISFISLYQQLGSKTSGNFGFYFPEILESVPTCSRVIIRLKSQGNILE